MKVFKIIGVVFSLHVGVIAVLIVQPGCSTSQPPTKTYQQQSTLGTPGTQPTASTLDDVIPATRSDASIDPAFNANIDGALPTGSDRREAPLRPSGEFSEFDSLNQPLAPLAPLPGDADMGPTVDIAGPSFETYTVKKGDSLWAISARKNVSLSDLYAANGLSKNSVLKVGQVIKIPVEGSSVRVDTVTPDTYQPTTLNSATISHKVRSGDTLSRIAKKYDTTIGGIKAANGKTSDVIRVGETLIIPVSGSVPAPSSTPAIAPKSGVSAPVPSASSAAPATGGRTHTVRAGEYPAAIAKKYGMTTNELLAINGITDPRSLQVGQKLIVSSTGSAANVATKTETVAAPAPRASAPKPAPVAGNGPVEINVVAAEPIIEGSATPTDEETDALTDALFDNAVEIPVIRLERE